jgi:hypothetical protein
MKFFPSLLLVAIAMCCIAPQPARAQDTADQIARLNARRDLMQAKMELRHYLQVEYPRQRRQLSAAIELTEAEIRDYRERLRAYEPYGRFSIGQPFLITIQDLRMCQRDAELRLRELWAERSALAHSHSDQWRLLAMQVHEARLRVVELEADDANTEEVATEQWIAQRQ